MRQCGSAKIDPRLLEDRSAEYADTCSWIDIAAMAADWFTNLMRDDCIQGILDSNMWCVAKTREFCDVKTRKGDQSRQWKAARMKAEAADGAFMGTAP